MMTTTSFGSIVPSLLVLLVVGILLNLYLAVVMGVVMTTIAVFRNERQAAIGLAIVTLLCAMYIWLGG